ncbi:unnamed protein product [Orchesella dallaii]|uniref:Protein msta n=1 Tax=Orchesella dallaii TaxID=48710 RepID=A0ABP1QBU1_9HEXA
MTQTSDDSSTNSSNSTSTVIMDHHHEQDGKGTLSASANTEEPKATAGKGAVDASGETVTCVTDSTTASAAQAPATTNCISEMDTNGDTSTFSKAPQCAICSEPCICYCKSCKRVSYCSKDHQKRHWKQHRPECFPVAVQVNSVFGSNLVVTRDIKRGEVILREKPLVSGPHLCFRNEDERTRNHWTATTLDEESKSEKIPSVCLACHKILLDEVSSSTAPTSCSKCGWPVCAECEKNPTHADQECKIFAESHLEPAALCDKVSQCLCVSVVRVLLHKIREPTKWSQFMDVLNKQAPMKDGLNSHAQAKKSTARSSDLITKSLGSIIQDFSVTDVEIDQIVRTLRTSAFITDNVGNYINGLGPGSTINSESHDAVKTRCKGKTASVYHLASMLTSNCIPNASWVIQDTLDFYLRASAPIKTGERITISFVDPLLGTWDRRKRLWEEKYLVCTCSRCSDPGELSTFFSAIKCPGEDGKTGGESIGVICECEGYLLPTDPLAAVTYTWNEEGGENDENTPEEKLCEERMAEWKCNVCLMRQAWGVIQNSLQKLKTYRDDICYEDDDGGRSSSSNTETDDKPEANNQVGVKDHQMNYTRLQLLQTRVDQITSLVGSVAHMNHYYILKMENEILSSISHLLEEGQVPLEEMEMWAVRMVEMCKKGLKVVNVLCPGLSKARGHLLYYLQQGLMINLLFKTSRAMRIPNADCSESECSPAKDAPSQEELMKKFQELLLARKEILEIFAIERGNSEESAMLKAVQHDSIEMRVLKNHFKCHQNISYYNFKIKFCE